MGGIGQSDYLVSSIGTKGEGGNASFSPFLSLNWRNKNICLSRSNRRLVKFFSIRHTK
jgi:hypothetical protein